MEKMIIRRNPTKHHAYTHIIMIDFSCLLPQPICESLSAAFLFMTTNGAINSGACALLCPHITTFI